MKESQDSHTKNPQDMSELLKKTYLQPMLKVYGDVTQITLKVKGEKDHNKSDNGINNNQGWS